MKIAQPQESNENWAPVTGESLEDMHISETIISTLVGFRKQLQKLVFHCSEALKAILLTLATSKAYEVVYHHDKHFTDRVRTWFFQFVRGLPVVGEKIQAQVDEAKSSAQVLKTQAQFKLRIYSETPIQSSFDKCSSESFKNSPMHFLKYQFLLQFLL